jgi:ABC-type uncharacterized transport system YnjBCD permease subunit
MNWLSLLGLDVVIARFRAAMIEGAIALDDRVALARLEWRDQRQRLVQALLLILAVGALSMVTLLLLSAAVLVQFWDTPHRTLVAWLVALTWFIAWAVAVAGLIAVLRGLGSGFALTCNELSQDWRAVKERL